MFRNWSRGKIFSPKKIAPDCLKVKTLCTAPSSSFHTFNRKPVKIIYSIAHKLEITRFDATRAVVLYCCIVLNSSISCHGKCGRSNDMDTIFNFSAFLNSSL